MKLGNPRLQSDGCWVPDWLVIRDEISDSAKMLYSRLVRWYNPRKGCTYVPQEDLAKQIGKSIRTIQRLISELVQHQLIELKRKKSFANLYDIHFNVEHEWQRADLEEEGARAATSGGSYPPDLTEDTTNVAAPNLLEETKERIPPSPQAGGGGRFDHEFEKLWSIYPSRGKAGDPKKPAKQKFIVARRAGHPFEVIEAALQRDIEVWTAEGKIRTPKIPMAQTWFGQERWNSKVTEDAPVAIGETILLPGATTPIRVPSAFDRARMRLGHVQQAADKAFGRKSKHADWVVVIEAFALDRARIFQEAGG